MFVRARFWILITLVYFSYALLVSLFHVAAASENLSTIDLTDRHKLATIVRDLVENDQNAGYVYRLSENLAFEIEIEGTSKGNALLHIANLTLHIFDEHDDGLIYDQGILQFDSVNLDQDPDNEIVISGIENQTHEKKNKAISAQAIVVVLDYECKDRRFLVRYRQGPSQLIYADDPALKGPVCSTKN